jgi:hypothetical protein
VSGNADRTFTNLTLSSTGSIAVVDPPFLASRSQINRRNIQRFSFADHAGDVAISLAVFLPANLSHVGCRRYSAFTQSKRTVETYYTPHAIVSA